MSCKEDEGYAMQPDFACYYCIIIFYNIQFKYQMSEILSSIPQSFATHYAVRNIPNI
jgi:hypothetical protein